MVKIFNPQDDRADTYPITLCLKTISWSTIGFEIMYSVVVYIIRVLLIRNAEHTRLHEYVIYSVSIKFGQFKRDVEVI